MKAGSFCLVCQAIDCAAHQRAPHFEPRQVQVLRAIINPRLSGEKQIAHSLGLSEATIKIYMSRIYDELGWLDRSLRRLAMWVMIHADELQAPRPNDEDFEDVAA